MVVQYRHRHIKSRRLLASRDWYGSVGGESLFAFVRRSDPYYVVLVTDGTSVRPCCSWGFARQMVAGSRYIPNLLSWTPHSALMRYGFAVLAVSAATLLRFLLSPLLGDSVPYITYFLAITVTGWIGGGRPALFALILSAAAASFFFFPPLYRFSISGMANVVGLGVFTAMGTLIALTCEAMKQAQRRAEQQAELLEKHGHALQQQMCELERHKEAWRESEERLRLAVESGDLIVWDSNLITQEVICSPNAKEIWGRDQGAVSDFLSSVHPEDQPLFEARREAAAAGRIIPIVEYRVIDAEGHIRWLQSRGKVRFDNEGRAVRFLGVSVDVTQRKLMEQKLRASVAEVQEERQRLQKSQEQLEEKIQELESFHDIVVGRELKMMQMEKEIDKLRGEYGPPTAEDS